MASSAPAQAAAPNFGSLLRSKPYVRLWTEANACRQIANTNSLTGAKLDARLRALTTWYRHFNSQGSNRFLLGRDCDGRSTSTLAAKLAARGAWVSNYRNGSFVSQSSRSADLNFHEAASIERKVPLSIATFWPGDWRPYELRSSGSKVARVRAQISKRARTVRINAASTVRPSGVPATWPYLRSRGKGLERGAVSLNTRDFVSWIRIGNEIMQVIRAPQLSDGVIKLRVRRGIWGTTVRGHRAGTRVMSPVYVGSSSQDSALSGTPSRNDPRFPLRYSLKVWRPSAHAWIIGRIRATFGPTWQGYNAIWLDTTSCVQYSNADPFGNQVFGWDERVGRKLTADAWGAAQRKKLSAIRHAFPGRKILANNLINRNPCTERLLKGSVDGGSFENWMKWGGAEAFDWRRTMQQLIDVQAHNWPAMLWVRWNHQFSGGAAQYRRLSYGSYLLAYRPAATRPMYGGPWGLAKPDDLFLWNWGKPKQRAGSLGRLQIDGTTLYGRRFANGLVLVNPTSSAVTYPLRGTFYDVVRLTSTGRPSPVTSITLGARDAAFLLRSV